MAFDKIFCMKKSYEAVGKKFSDVIPLEAAMKLNNQENS